PLATMTLWMQSTYAEWLVNELQGHWLSNWNSKEHRTASQSTAPAGALGNSTNAVRNATNNGKASLGVKRLKWLGVISGAAIEDLRGYPLQRGTLALRPSVLLLLA